MRCQKTGCGGEIVDGVCKSCAAPQNAGAIVTSSIPEEASDQAPSLVGVPTAAPGVLPASLPSDSASLPSSASSLASAAAVQRGQSGDASPFGNAERLASIEGAGVGSHSAVDRSAELKLQKVSARLKKIDGKEALLQASEALKTVVPDKFESWRAQADLWLAAIRQLQTRELNQDDTVLLMGIPLIERNLRDAAEEALRQCAHFAPTFEQRVSFIDEANNIRNMSWF